MNENKEIKDSQTFDSWGKLEKQRNQFMKPEDRQVLINTVYRGLEEDYSPWVNKMTEKDRLILNKCLKSFPQLEWTRGNRTWWIDRLKKKS